MNEHNEHNEHNEAEIMQRLAILHDDLIELKREIAACEADLHRKREVNSMTKMLK